MAVRSRRFFGPTLLVSPALTTTLYVPPANRTPRFSMVLIYNSHSSSVRVTLGLGAAPNEQTMWSENIPGGITLDVLDQLVIDPGQRLWAVAGTASVVVVTGCGSLLEGPPT